MTSTEDDDHAHKRVKKNNGSKFALPTRDEQVQLRETENLFKSNLLKLQTAELLEEVHSSSSHRLPSKVDTWMQSIKELILSAKTDNNKVGSKFIKSKKFLNLDLVNPSTTISFVPPTEIVHIGSSSSLHAQTKPYMNVDLSVTMPESMFEEQDVQNHIYFDKRKLFLAVIANCLSDASAAVSNGGGGVDVGVLSFALFKGDARKPILVLQPTAFKSSFVIRIIPSLPGTCTVMKKGDLKLRKNNVRPQWWQEAVAKHKESQAKGRKTPAPVLDATKLVATPDYNMCILEDMVINTHFQILEQVVVHHCAVAASIIVLLKVWLTQTTLRFRSDCLDGHTASLLVAYLVQNRLIHNNMTPIQGFLVCLKFLVDWPFARSICDFASPTMTKDVSEDRRVWLDEYPAVLLHPITDSPVVYNALWRVSVSGIKDVQREAQTALRLLSQNQSSGPVLGGSGGMGASKAVVVAAAGEMEEKDSFEAVFLRKATLAQKYDMFVHIPLNLAADTSELTQSASLRFDGAPLVQRLVKLTQAVLAYALTDRVASLSVFPRYVSKDVSTGFIKKVTQGHSPQWPSSSSSSAAATATATEGDSCWMITVGLVLHHGTANRRVDRDTGAVARLPALETERDEPSSSSLQTVTAAAAVDMDFASFWGPKAQLRRFQDGGIVQAAIWGRDKACFASDYNRAEQILTEIIHSSIKTHIPSKYYHHIHCIGAQLEQYLPCNAVNTDCRHSGQGSTITVPDSALNFGRKAVETLDGLRSILTSQLKGLPLYIERLSAASEYLRYTALFPITPNVLTLTGAERKAALKAVEGEDINKLSAPLVLVATLESSGHWPVGSSEAFEKTKCAYLLRASELLREQFQIQSFVVEHENASSCLDIMHGGYVYRLILCCKDSQGKVILFTNNAGVVMTSSGGVDTVESIKRQGGATSAVDASMQEHITLYLRRALEIAPLHHQMIHNVHSRFSSGSYCQAVRMLAYWFSSQLFSGCLTHEALELLTASVFTSAASALAPTTATAGFLRTLCRLVEHNWSESPLVVHDAPDGSAGGAAGVVGGSEVHMHAMKAGSAVVNRGVMAINIQAQFERTKGKGKNTSAGVGAGSDMPSLFITAPYEATVGHRALYCQSLPHGYAVPEPMTLSMILTQARHTVQLLSQWMEGASAIPSRVESQHQLKQQPSYVLMSSDAALMDAIMMTPNREIQAHSNVTLQFNKNIALKLAPSKPSTAALAGMRGGSHYWNEYAANGGSLTTRLNVFSNLPAAATSTKALIVRNAPLPHPMQAEVMQHLRANFHSQCLFFWNHVEGRNIYVVFRPKILLPQKFSIMKTHHMIPLNIMDNVHHNDHNNEHNTNDEVSMSSGNNDNNSEPHLLINTTELVSEMMSIGRGLIDQVTYN